MDLCFWPRFSVVLVCVELCSNEEKNREEKKQKILSSKVGGHHSNWALTTFGHLGIMDLCFWPRFSVVLVCVELWVCPPKLQKARSHTVGCAVAQPINPLKLGQTLSTPNFRSCEHKPTLKRGQKQRSMIPRDEIVGAFRWSNVESLIDTHSRMCGCSTHQPVEAWPNVVNTQFSKLWTTLEDTFLFFSFLCSLGGQTHSLTQTNTKARPETKVHDP
jgi:hypothetical protein